LVENVFIGLLLIASLGLIVGVLLQSGRSAGLSGAISGGGEALFGKKKGLDNLFSKVTTGFAIGYMVFAVLVTIFRG